MIGTRNRRRPRTLPLELHWGERRPLPARWVLPEGARPRDPLQTGADALDFTNHMLLLCADVATRCEELRHIQMPRVLVSFTSSRNRSRYGLQARVTPLRFRDGSLTRRHGS